MKKEKTVINSLQACLPQVGIGELNPLVELKFN